MITERKWSTPGLEYQPLGGVIEAEIQRLEWHELPIKDAPFSQGYAIREIIGSISGRVLKVAWNGVVGRYGLYGVRVAYRDADVTAYYLDLGTEVTPLFHDVTKKQEAA